MSKNSVTQINIGISNKGVSFNKDKVKNTMKEMIRKSVSGTLSDNNININPFINKTIVQNKPKPGNTLDLHKEKIIELDEINKAAEKTYSISNNILQTLLLENSDTQKIIDYLRKQNENFNKTYEDLDAEEKRKSYKEELQIEEARKELEENMKIIQELKEECYGMESELNDKEFRLFDMKQKSNEIAHKIEFISIELEDKIKLKKYKENELLTKGRELDDTKLRIMDVRRITTEYIDYLRMIHNDLQESKGNIRVFCRVRPLITRETKEEILNQSNYIEFPNMNTIVLNGPVMKSNVGKSKDTQQREVYRFDRVFRQEDNQDEVFKEISQLVQSALDGYKVCIFAYGQTGSGKTYTMEGEEEDKRGIIPRSIEQIFEFKSTLENLGWNFSVEASCVEIYMDQVRDLLMNSANNVVPHNKTDKFQSYEVKKVEDVDSLLELVGQKRAVAETQCNEKSSRSHCIFQLKIMGKNAQTKQERNGALNLIDLAGSERVSSSKVEGERLKETISINKSLTALKSVIQALVNTNIKSTTHIPYRDSILTHILQNYLGGDSKTLMFVNISPLMSNFSESSCSLKFASDVNSCYIKSNDDK